MSNLQRMGGFLSGRGVRRAERRLPNWGSLVQFAWFYSLAGFCSIAWFCSLARFCSLGRFSRPCGSASQEPKTAPGSSAGVVPLRESAGE